jgi:hypothetical protein
MGGGSAGIRTLANVRAEMRNGNTGVLTSLRDDAQIWPGDAPD